MATKRYEVQTQFFLQIPVPNLTDLTHFPGSMILFYKDLIMDAS